jgi:glycosyltransferase involved in cell wall biosynthesis
MNRSPRPYLSVCIPVLNGENYLAEAIESVVNQASPKWELCISDNCSHDKTHEICNQFRDCSQIRYSRSDVKLTGPQNWDRVLRMAEGQWLTVLGHDDLLLPSAIDTLASSVFEHPENRIVISQPINIDQDGTPLPRQHGPLENFAQLTSVPRSQFLDKLVKGMVFSPTGLFYNKSLLNEFGGFATELRGCVDWEFLMRVLAGSDVTVVPQAMAKYRFHAAQDSRDFVLGAHNDAELMADRMLAYNHLSESQQKVMMHNMKAFLYRTLTFRIASKKFTIREIQDYRSIVASRVSAWQDNERLNYLMGSAEPASFKNRFVWEVSRSSLALCILRPVIRWMRSGVASR